METTLVFFSISDIKATVARHHLTEAGIESFVVNKKDSVYSGILGGTVEVFVRVDDEEKARQILEEHNMFD